VQASGLTKKVEPQDGASIRDFTDLLLSHPDKASAWLTQADKYMQAYVESPTTFILPRAHAFMQPVIEVYAYHLDGFTQYLMGVRDCFEKQSTGWEGVHSLYRRVLGRHTQKLRRERSNRAIAKAEELYGKVGYHERLQWVANLEHGWAKRRLEFLDKHRAKLGGRRLTVDERAELLFEFWDIIDTEIFEGKVPSWN
jgi:hypothetical protein